MDLRTWTESSKGDKKRGGGGGVRVFQRQSLPLAHAHKEVEVYIHWLGKNGVYRSQETFSFFVGEKYQPTDAAYKT